MEVVPGGGVGNQLTNDYDGAAGCAGCFSVDEGGNLYTSSMTGDYKPSPNGKAGACIVTLEK